MNHILTLQATDRSHPTLRRTCVEHRNARGRVWNIMGMETFAPTREQQAVIEHEGSHLLVFAGPGTGKTETLARRFAWLVAERGVAPDEILVLTFSRHAAGTMRERIVTRLREAAAGAFAVRELHVRTFH